MHFLADFGDVKKQMKRIRFEKKWSTVRFDRGGGGGSKAIWAMRNCAYGNNTFQKGAPLSLNEIKIPTHKRKKRLGLVQKNGEVKICKIYRKDMRDKGKERHQVRQTDI